MSIDSHTKQRGVSILVLDRAKKIFMKLRRNETMRTSLKAHTDNGFTNREKNTRTFVCSGLLL